MNITIHFEQQPLAELEPSRVEYLDGLSEPQELMLEVTVPSCTGHGIFSGHERIGHLLVNPENELIEFHLQRPFWVFGQSVVRQSIARLGVNRALVKTFDTLFLSSAIEYQRSVRTLGLLVRDYVPRTLPEIEHLRYSARDATLQDLDAIFAIDQDVFTVRERLRLIVEQGWMRLFERNGLIGFAIRRLIRPQSSDVDVGIAVDRPYRNKGYAIYMMHDMVRHCIELGLNPVAGCAVNNLASRRMGERVGMVARHRLLELSF
jgi:GNAT superfamily N-acetyltransferase